MQKPLNTFLRLLLFWMIFFFIQRCIFITVNFSSFSGTAGELLYTNVKAFIVDLSASLYLTSIPILAMIAGIFTGRDHAVNKVIDMETRIMIVLCSLIGSGDAGLFRVWGTKINGKALSYLAYPQDLLPTLFAIENIGLYLIVLSQVVFSFWLYLKLRKPFEKTEAGIFYKTAGSILVIAFFVIGTRGGLQKRPLNRGWIYHSPKAFLNHASLNGFWNVADLLVKQFAKQQNPYTFFAPEKAKLLLDSMNRAPVDTSVMILNTPRPNVIIIFLESWAADVVGCVGGEKDVTPKFAELARNGILFTRFYSTGFRTEQGFLAALSSYPAQPVSSIIRSIDKFDKLPNLIRVMNNQGYHTSFYSGGDLKFDNIESYMYAGGTQKMMGENDFEIRQKTSWGAYDEETLAMHLRELAQTPQPFFSALTTMTTHEWFEADVPALFSGDKDRISDKYRNTMHYADNCLYQYLKEAEKQPWYANTLFVLMADHSCWFPKHRANYETERYHIPMLITGGALKKELRGKTISRLASHLDIPATILAQLGIKNTEFPRSKDLFNPYSPAYAYYAFDNGFGIISNTAEVVYDHNQQKVIMGAGASKAQEKLVESGKAFLQTNFQENIDYSEAGK